VCFPSDDEPGEGDYKGANLFGFFILFATVFLVATLLVYAILPRILPKMRNLNGVIVICYLASMTVMNISFAILFLVRGSDMSTSLCTTIDKLTCFHYANSYN
jgi:hypothetical protein